MSHLHHKVSALVDGELSGSTRSRAINHLRSCSACRHEVEQTLALKSRLTGLPDARPPADLFARLGDVSESLADQGSAPRRVSTRHRVLVGAGSMSMAVVTLAYAVGGAEPVAVRTVSPPVDEFAADFAETSGLAPLSDPAVEALYPPTAYATTADSRVPADVQLVSSPKSDRAPTPARGDDSAAVAALRRAVAAPRRVAYVGVREVNGVTRGQAATFQIEVRHVPGQGTRFQVPSGLDETTATFVTQGETAERQGLAGGRLDQLVAGYDLTVAGTGSVAGRSASVVSASNDGALAARFFIDEATGMLLRRELYDAGRLVRSSSFVSVSTATSGFISHLPPELDAPVATTVSTRLAPSLNDDGWTCPADLDDDFALTKLHQIQVDGDVLHAAYSDGLSTVSVFEQRGSLDDSGLVGFRHVVVGGSPVTLKEGLPTVAVWESAGTVYTVVTDAPAGTAARIIASLPHDEPSAQSDDGLRVTRGLTRIGSFLTPGD